MNIAFLIPTLQSGGAERVASLLCSAWAERGEHVTLLTYASEAQKPFYPLHAAIACRPLDCPGGQGNALRALGANARRIALLREALRENRPDLLICFMPEASVPGVAAARSLNIPVIACERSDPRFIPAGRMQRLLRMLAYPFASAVVVQTAEAARYFAPYITAHTIPNPVLAPAVGSESAPQRPFIAALGRLSTEKNFDVLLRAFALISSNRPMLDLIIMGEGPERSRLESLSASLDLAGRVKLPGARANPFALLRHASLFVMPSAFEGFPNALCEAMACGLPVIAGQAMGTRAVIENNVNGILADISTPEALASAMSRLLDDSDMAARLGAQARGIVETLSMRRILERWDDLFARRLYSRR